jgi:D-aminoacyl-tRNA deacylase
VDTGRALLLSEARFSVNNDTQCDSALLLIGLLLLRRSNHCIVRAVIQRVSQAQVVTDGTVLARIGAGLCILVGIGREDSQTNAETLAAKIQSLRVFEDGQSKMNLSVRDIGGELLVVSQFTLYGDCNRGNRPSFTAAAMPAAAERLYEYFVQRLRASGLAVSTGRFGAHMDVALTNDGPVTLILEF